MDDQISNVGNPGKGVSENEHRVSLVKESIAQQKKRAYQAQPPKSSGHNHTFELLGSVPLDKKAREKRHIPQPSDHFPDIPGNHQQLAILPEQLSNPVHE